MVGDGENGLRVRAASFRAWESKAPPARGAAFFGEKKKKDAVRRGLAGCEVSPGLLRAGMARCAGSTAPGQFSLPVFSLLLFLLYLSSLHRKSPSPRVPAAGWQPVTFTNPFSSRVRSSPLCRIRWIVWVAPGGIRTFPAGLPWSFASVQRDRRLPLSPPHSSKSWITRCLVRWRCLKAFLARCNPNHPCHSHLRNCSPVPSGPLFPKSSLGASACKHTDPHTAAHRGPAGRTRHGEATGCRGAAAPHREVTRGDFLTPPLRLSGPRPLPSGEEPRRRALLAAPYLQHMFRTSIRFQSVLLGAGC